jgi:hypothetical protein
MSLVIIQKGFCGMRKEAFRGDGWIARVAFLGLASLAACATPAGDMGKSVAEINAELEATGISTLPAIGGAPAPVEAASSSAGKPK